MSTVTHVNDHTFDSAIPQDGIAVVDLSASWCGPCHAYAPIVEASAQRHPHITHLALDVDESPSIAARYSVASVPTTLFFRDGYLIGGFPGALPANRLDDLIAQTERLDMNRVRETIGNQKR